MRKDRLTAILVGAALLLLAGCGTQGIPHSSLLLRNATSNAIISTAAVQGTVTLAVNQTLSLLVVRTFKDDAGNTQTSDVTAFAEYHLTDGIGVASVDAYGNITALSAGEAQLAAKFRADGLDPYDTVRLTIVVQ